MELCLHQASNKFLLIFGWGAMVEPACASEQCLIYRSIDLTTYTYSLAKGVDKVVYIMHVCFIMHRFFHLSCNIYKAST